MINPFKYGVAVTGTDFVDRGRELKELEDEVLSGKSVVLYSPRRLGKTSLLMELFKRLERRTIPVYMNLYGIDSMENFAREIAERVMKAAFTTLEKAREGIKLLTELRPSLVLTPEGEIKLDIARRITPKTLEEVLDFPEKTAEERGKRIVVAFDEFQEIGLLDGVVIEKMMKAKFERHERVAYIFAGSRRHLLHQIFTDEGRPLFKFARPMELGNIPMGDFAEFIASKFKGSGGGMEKSVLGRILEFTQGHPYFTQQLCHELWYITKRVNDWPAVEQAIDNILAHHEVEYERMWDGLPGVQRYLLLGLAKEPGLSPYSTAFILKYGVKTSAHVQRAMSSLEAKGIIEDGKISDLFFRQWLKTRLS